jgi:hypothetical protein
MFTNFQKRKDDVNFFLFFFKKKEEINNMEKKKGERMKHIIKLNTQFK